MSVNRSIIVICFIIYLAFPGFTQSEYRYSSGLRSWRFPYKADFKQKTNYGNDILEELARDFLKPPRFVNITIGFREEISVLPENLLSVLAVIRFSDFSLSGYLQYRKFPMDDVLMPSSFRFELKNATKPDNDNGTILEFEGIVPAGSASIVFKLPRLSIDTAVDTLIARNFRFIYSDSDFQRFYARKSLIDDYYASVAMLENLEVETRGWDMRDPVGIPLNFIRLSELVRMVNLTRNRDFGNSLLQGGYDPGHLLEKHLALFKISRTCLFNLAETLEKSGALKGCMPADSLASYFMERLMRYIRLGALMDNIQGKIYQDYLNAFYSDRVFGSDSDFIQSVLIRMFPDARPDTLLSWASESLMNAYRTKAKALIAGKKYSDAVLLMENAHKMAMVNPYLTNHNGWEDMMSVGVNGIYNSYAGIASSSLESGSVNFAMEYLQKAEKYMELYPAYITSDSIYRRVYRSIFIGQLDHCSDLLDKGNYTEALECLNSHEQTFYGKALEMLAPDILDKKEKARLGIIRDYKERSRKALVHGLSDSALVYFDKAGMMLSNTYAAAGARQDLDSLAPVIALIRVKKINILASAYYRQRQFPRAIMQFEQAEIISAAYAVPSDPVADSLYQQSYKQWLLDRISQEQRFIWSNKPDSAGSFLTLASETAKSKGLAQDPDILKAIALYQSRISGRSCETLEDSLVLFNIRAGRCFAIQNFNRGAGILEHAIIQAEKMSNCSPNITALKDSLNKYKDAADYQENLDEVNIAMVTGDYARGLNLLAANEKNYTLKRIDYFGIPLTSVYDYVATKANPFISIQALEYYLNQNDPVEALRYLKLLNVQGMHDIQTYSYQEKTARSLSVRDKLANANADPQQIVRRYSAANSWMSRFTEVYIKAWEKL
ncbi:MAG: hypothetical protein ACOYM0_03245 [Bacteroidales bacterium]